MDKYILAKEDLKESQDWIRKRKLISGMSEEEIDAEFKSQMREPKYEMGFQNDFPKLSIDDQRKLADLELQDSILEARLFQIQEEIQHFNSKMKQLEELRQANHERICKIQGHRLSVSVYSSSKDEYMPGNLYRVCEVCGKKFYGIEIGQKDCVVRVLKNDPTIQY